MSLVMAADLWQTLCLLAKRYPTARFVLDQHEGRVVRVEVWQDKETRVLCVPARHDAAAHTAYLT